MYKVTMRSTLIPFMLILAVGICLSIFVPTYFHDMKIEIPAFALFPGEIAISLIMAVLLFENASPAELVKLAGWLLCIGALDGVLCNKVTCSTLWLPDATLQMNWVQLIAFNFTGMIGIVSLFSSEPDKGYGGAQTAARESAAKEAPREQAVREAGKEATAPSKMDFSPQEAPVQGQEAQDLLSQLDHGRIDKLEQSISSVQDHVSLETLFSEETQAALGVRAKSEPAGAIIEERPEPAAAQAAPEPEPVAGAPAEPAAASQQGGLFSDVSGDIEDIFGSLVGPEAQKDFSPAEKAAAEAARIAPKADAAPPAAPEPVAAPEPQAGPVASIGPKLTEDGSGAKAAVKEFGKLSATAAVKPENTAGTLKTIGQMLLDTGAVERILRKGEVQEKGSKWRVLTVDRGANLQALMDKIASYEGVESALLMGKDGLLLSNTESVAALKYVFGPLSLAMHSTTNLGTSKLQMGELRQAVLRTGDKLNILTDVGSAILAVFGSWTPGKLNGLINHINNSVAGSTAVEGERGEFVEMSEDVQEAPAARAAEPMPSPPPAASGLLSVSDNEMSDLFDSLLSEESADKKKEAAEPAAPEPAAPAQPAAAHSGLLSVSDNEMSDLFDNLLSEESADKKKEAAEPAAPEPAAPAQPAASVLNVSDSEMSDIFDNLLSEDSADKKKETPAPAPSEAPAAPATETPPAPTPETAPAGGLLNVSEKEVGEIFDNLPGEQAAEKKSMNFSPAEAPPAETPPAAAPPAETPAPVAEAPPEQRPGKPDKKRKGDGKPAQQMKEFGKLSIQAAQKDTGTDAGAMKAIGKQLIDVQAVENIIKAGEKREKIGSGMTTARVISAARGEGIKSLLCKIDAFEGVIGSLIVGHDGLVIASTLKGGIDKDMMGAMSTAIYSHLDVAIKKLERGKLQQSVFIGSDNKLTVMTAVAVGILAVFVDEAGVEKVNGLLTAIENTVRG
jgi:uncharacterized protein